MMWGVLSLEGSSMEGVEALECQQKGRRADSEVGPFGPDFKKVRGKPIGGRLLSADKVTIMGYGRGEGGVAEGRKNPCE